MMGDGLIAGRPVRCIDHGLRPGGTSACSSCAAYGDAACDSLGSRFCDLSPVGRGCGLSSVTATHRKLVIESGTIGTPDIVFADSLGVDPRREFSYTGHSHVSFVIALCCRRFALDG
jgi:hypothetical protein